MKCQRAREETSGIFARASWMRFSPKHPLPGRQRLLHLLGRVRLGHRHQLDFLRRAAGTPGRLGHARPHLCQPLGDRAFH